MSNTKLSESKNRPRFLTAASLFDGHDASINIMRRILQASGAEVIHLGHNRSVEEIATCAIEEDVQGIAISSYQGGHLEFFKYIFDQLRTQKATHICLFGGGGGTITQQEVKELEEYGITRVYSPEDGRQLGLQGIIDDMLHRAQKNPMENIDWNELIHFEKSRQALAQVITCLEWGKNKIPPEERSRWNAVQKKIESSQKRGKVVGITGTGGAGKSSLTDEIILRILETDPRARIAVLAVDPTRQKTGGALLGDRLRMNCISNPRCFMRSLATREAKTALSPATEGIVHLFRSAQFDWIFVETSGIGQSDIPIVEFADIHIYVMTSEFGAPTQLEKINMLDYADIVAINKFEKAGALDALTDVRKQLRRNRPELLKIELGFLPVFGTTASRFSDKGVDALFAHLKKVTRTIPSFQILDKPFDPLQCVYSSVVPKDRALYLSQVIHSVRHYKEKVLAAANQVSHIDSIKTILSDTSALTTECQKTLNDRLKTMEGQLDLDARKNLESYGEIQTHLKSDEFGYEIRKTKIQAPLTFTSLSQNRIRKIALPRFHSQSELLKFLMLENLPGYFPFTAGVFPLRRSEEDPKRMFAGEGTPSRTNRRFHLLCEGEKAKRLSTAFDSVTLYGEDPHERPDIFGKVGESGVSICSLDDMKKLYAGFDLCSPHVSVSMTINGPAPMLLAFYFNTAIDQQVDQFEKDQKRSPNPEEKERIKKEVLRKVRGTVQADILKEDQAQNTCIFSTNFALRMMGDIQQYFVDNHIKNYYSVSISGYHIAEAGANPISQLAFTLANGFTYVEYYLSRGMKIDDFVPNFSFFFSNALDAEYTVIGRVARRIWAIAMRDLYGANERSQKLKYHIQTSGRSLHAQEIGFNDIRTTLQALIAYFDQCNSLHTNAYDEAVTTPTEESVRKAMAIQMIVAKEFGWAKCENPHQGSFFIEELTDLVEEAVLNEFERLSLRGGVLGAMETHYQRSKIQEESLHYEKLKHSGELPIVGVNTFLGNSAEPLSPKSLTRATPAEKQEQIQNLMEFKAKHAQESSSALQKLKDAARRGENLFAVLMDSARVCTLGEMTRALYEVGGRYRRGL